jgi:hypothetical protein
VTPRASPCDFFLTVASIAIFRLLAPAADASLAAACFDLLALLNSRSHARSRLMIRA